MINPLLIYWKDVRSAYKLLEAGRFWGFLPQRGNTLHRWGEIDSPTPNFTLQHVIYNVHTSTLVTCLWAKYNQVESTYLQKKVTSL